MLPIHDIDPLVSPSPSISYAFGNENCALHTRRQPGRTARELTERPAHVRDVVVAGEEPAKEKKNAPANDGQGYLPKRKPKSSVPGRTSLARLGHEVQKDELARKPSKLPPTAPSQFPLRGVMEMIMMMLLTPQS